MRPFFTDPHTYKTWKGANKQLQKVLGLAKEEYMWNRYTIATTPEGLFYILVLCDMNSHPNSHHFFLHHKCAVYCK